MNIVRDISTLLTSCFSFILFLFLFKPRYSTKKTIIASLCTMVPLFAINAGLLLILGPEKMGTLILLTCSLPSLIIFWFLAKYRDGRFFFTFCLADTIILEILYITSILEHYLGGQHIVMLILRLVLCLLVSVFVFIVVRPAYRSVQDQVKKGWYVFSAIGLIFYIVLSLSMSYPEIITQRPEYLPSFILLLILMPMLYINIFTTLRHQQKLHEIAHQDDILRIQVANMTARVEEFSQADAKFRMERHNFRHKMKTIETLVEKQQYDELRQLVSEYADAIQDSQVRHYCTFPIIDAVLSSYLLRAENSGIQVTAGMAFPDKLPVSETELATVFANAIENAIQACGKVPMEERFIKIQVLNVPRFMIQISNSCNGRVTFDDNHLPTTRDPGHGLGTRSIAAFCEKNDALYEFKAIDKTFALRIVFG